MDAGSILGQIFNFCLAFIAGSVGFYAFKLIRFPAAALLGSMAVTGFLNILGWFPQFNSWLLSFACAVMIGIVIGRQININIIRHAKTMVRPVLVQITGILALSLLCGFILYLLGGGKIALDTAFVSSSAGGLTEMMVFGLSIGADVTIIAFVQLFRLVTFLSLVPYSAKLANKLGDKRPKTQDKHKAQPMPGFSAGHYAVLICAAVGGAALGYWLHIPAGSMLGSMFGCGLTAIIFKKKYTYSPKLRYIAQIGLGLVMGLRITPDFLSLLTSMFLPTLAVSAVMLTGCLLLALLQYKTTDYDLTTCLLCSSPAGMSQIAVYAEETGADVFTASVFHTARIVSIVIVYPWLAMHLI